jgi:hypothetical protein
MVQRHPLTQLGVCAAFHSGGKTRLVAGTTCAYVRIALEDFVSEKPPGRIAVFGGKDHQVPEK